MKCLETSSGISVDIWKDVPNTLVAPDIHEEHLAAIKKETSLSKPDKAKLRELMKSTYEIRRKDILSEVTPIRNIIKEYPPLATCAGVSKWTEKVYKVLNMILKSN